MPDCQGCRCTQIIISNHSGNYANLYPVCRYWVHYSVLWSRAFSEGDVEHSWWRHQMEAFSALLAICARNSPVPGEFPTQRPVTPSCDVSLICVWINGWVNNRKAGDLRRYRAHYDVSVMLLECPKVTSQKPYGVFVIPAVLPMGYVGIGIGMRKTTCKENRVLLHIIKRNRFLWASRIRVRLIIHPCEKVIGIFFRHNFFTIYFCCLF